jgi:hypothetical protein
MKKIPILIFNSKKPDIFRMEINSVVLVTIPAILVMDQVRISVPHS